MTNEERASLIAQYNEAIHYGDEDAIKRLGDLLLNQINAKIMTEDKYQARTH